MIEVLRQYIEHLVIHLTYVIDSITFGLDKSQLESDLIPKKQKRRAGSPEGKQDLLKAKLRGPHQE